MENKSNLRHMVESLTGRWQAVPAATQARHGAWWGGGRGARSKNPRNQTQGYPEALVVPGVGSPTPRGPTAGGSNGTCVLGPRPVCLRPLDFTWHRQYVPHTVPKPHLCKPHNCPARKRPCPLLTQRSLTQQIRDRVEADTVARAVCVSVRLCVCPQGKKPGQRGTLGSAEDRATTQTSK